MKTPKIQESTSPSSALSLLIGIEWGLEYALREAERQHAPGLVTEGLRRELAGARFARRKLAEAER